MARLAHPNSSASVEEILGNDAEGEGEIYDVYEVDYYEVVEVPDVRINREGQATAESEAGRTDHLQMSAPSREI